MNQIKPIIRRYSNVQLRKRNIIPVKASEIKLIITSNLLSFKSMIPDAQPPKQTRIKVVFGIWINVEIETNPITVNRRWNTSKGK